MDDELRPEYDLSKLLKEGVRGKYADRYREGTNLVLLAPVLVDENRLLMWPRSFLTKQP